MSNGRSWHIIRARKSSFAFQATELFGVLACELQPDACTHPVTFRDNNRAKCLQSATERSRLIVGNPGGAT